jgi:hypothetical protein
MANNSLEQLKKWQQVSFDQNKEIIDLIKQLPIVHLPPFKIQVHLRGLLSPHKDHPKKHVLLRILSLNYQIFLKVHHMRCSRQDLWRKVFY